MFDEFAYLNSTEYGDPEAVEEDPTETLAAPLRKHFDNREELCRYVREISGPDVGVLFSCGKDSIGTYLFVRDYFERVHVVYRYASWPILSFVEDAIQYFEDLWGIRIWRLPDYHFYRKLLGGFYQPPHKRWVVPKALFAHREKITAAYMNQEFANFIGAPEMYWANGLRQNDTLLRRSMINMHGSVNHATRYFSAIFDMGKPELLDMIQSQGIKLPADYRMFGRSFDGLDYEYAAPIKRHFPEDWEIVKRIFPLVEAEIKRGEYANARRIS